MPSPALAGMQWDPISPLTLHLLTLSEPPSPSPLTLHRIFPSLSLSLPSSPSSLGGQYLCYTWRWVVAQSLAHIAENKATVAVIDGSMSLSSSLSPSSSLFPSLSFTSSSSLSFASSSHFHSSHPPHTAPGCHRSSPDVPP